MNRVNFSHISIVILLLFSCGKKEVPPPQAVLPVPSEAQLAWHEMETNAFVHYTTNTFTGLEWGYGDESPEVFNPSEQDPDQWVSVLKDAGFKGVIFTCKHHDGFCLWPSKYTDHSVENSPYKNGEGDVVKEVSDACKKYGLKFGVYLSPWDRNRADYGKPEYITYYRNQLRELFTNYGPVFEMWFDGANGGDGYYGGAREERRIDRENYYDWPGTLAMVKEIEPEVIFFSDAGPGVRWCGNEQGFAGETNWNNISPDTLYAGKSGITDLLNTGSENGTHWIPAEVDVSIRPGWFYHQEEDTLVKSPQQLFEIYLKSVGRGSTLLLNVPPDRRGKIHENDIAVLKSWKEMLDSEFKINHAAKARVKVDSHRGKSALYAGENTTDGNKETYWATDDDIVAGNIEIDLGGEQVVKYLLLQEYIKLGQRVKAFDISVWKDGNWEQVASGTTIGYKRILPLEPVTTAKIRVTIRDARACPLISNIEVY